MNKRVYLAILAIVTVLCIVGGSIYHFCSWGVRFWGNNDKASKGNISYVDSVDGFTAISGNFNVTDLNISTGADSFNIAYDGNEEIKVDYKIENGVLYLSQKGGTNWSFGMHNSLKSKTTITIPSGTTLTSITLTCDVGDVDLTNLTADNVSLQADVGDVDVNNCSFKSFTIDADTGDIDVENCRGTNLTITGDVGDIDAKRNDYTKMDITSDVGDIDIETLNATSEYSLDLDASVGETHVDGSKKGKEYNATGSSDKSIRANASVGDISMN